MTKINVGNETWELHDATGRVGRAGTAMPVGAALPASWRVFGPWGPETTRPSAVGAAPGVDIHRPMAQPRDPALDRWAASLTAVPATVTIAGVERPGHDVAPTDDTLDLDALYGGHDETEGHQAIAIGELQLAEDGELAIGCGADWWMQWWVDGKLVYDTLATGNSTAASCDSHMICLPLTAGRHLVIVRLISGGAGRWFFCATLMDPDEAARKAALTSPDWEFRVNGSEIHPPAGAIDPMLAMRTDTAWRDFTAEFDFRWESGWTSAGFVFRARDPRHYYLVHFPAVGQQTRAEHFWGCVSKVDERGYMEVLTMEMLHGVSSMIGLWHHVKVVAEEDTIRVWVDGRPMSTVVDETYPESGYVGLSVYDAFGGLSFGGSSSSFRNLTMRGAPAPAPPCQAEPALRRNWFRVTDIHGSGCGSIGRAANGDLLISLKKGDWLRSRDNGRTWSVAPIPAEPGLLWQMKDGRLGLLHVDSTPPFALTRQVSDDSGATWSPPVVVGALAFADALPWKRASISSLLVSRSGALCASVIASTDHSQGVPRGFHDILDIAGYSIRSTDDGATWSAPVNMDGDFPLGPPGQVSKEWLEISMAQTADGKIIILGRPYRSPVMWEGWSYDDGVTWQPLTRGPFPMYACTRSMTSTQNGALLIGGRFPGMGVQVSHDGGMTWKGYGIDNASWANGVMFEVEPNVVLFVYGGKDEPRELRGQLIRVTEDSIVPVRR